MVMGKKRLREGQLAVPQDREVVEFVQGQQPKFGQRLVSNGVLLAASLQLEATSTVQCSRNPSLPHRCHRVYREGGA